MINNYQFTKLRQGMGRGILSSQEVDLLLLIDWDIFNLVIFSRFKVAQ